MSQLSHRICAQQKAAFPLPGWPRGQSPSLVPWILREIQSLIREP